MKVQIMHDTKFGNGERLAELLKKEFPGGSEIKINHVKNTSPSIIAEDKPDVLILGGAIRAFRGGPASKKWIKELNKELKKNKHKIKYATGFITHGLPTDKVQGFAKRYLNKIKKTSMIEKTYSTLLTARVKAQEGPIFEEELEKAKEYIQEFIEWM